MATKVKICGIKQSDEVAFVNEMDIDYIGLVFAESIRQVDIDTAQMIASALRDDIQLCGIFVDHTVEEINEIVRVVGLDIAQLHRNYTIEMIRDIQIPVWYAISIKDAQSVSQIETVASYDNVDGVVTDTYVKGREGGTGKIFSWELLDGIDESVCLILAGGLSPDNIEEAIARVSPDIVDISSGVEHTVDGHTSKSRSKIASLLRKVKGNEQY